MPYIPHTEDDVRAMLATIGVESIDELFREVPEDMRFTRELNVPEGLDERRLAHHLQVLAERNLISAA